LANGALHDVSWVQMEPAPANTGHQGNARHSGIHTLCSFVGVPPRCGVVPHVSSRIEQLHRKLHRAAASDPPPQSGGSDMRADIAEAHRLTDALEQFPEIVPVS